MHTDPVHIWTPSAAEAQKAGEPVVALRLDLTLSDRELRALGGRQHPDHYWHEIGRIVGDAVFKTARELLTGARG